MEHKIDVRNKLIAAGWSRGSLIDLKLKTNQSVTEKLPKCIIEEANKYEKAFLGVLTYDCAVVHDCFYEEPWLQCFVFWSAEKDNSYLHGRNPRRYHFPIKIQDQLHYMEATSLSLCQLERECLLNLTPSNDAKWPDNQLHSVLTWTTSRVLQPTFPDEWNRRVGRAKKLFEKIWKSNVFTSNISAIYISLNTFDELCENKAYEAKVLLTHRLEGAELRIFMKENKEDQLIQKLQAAFSTVKDVKTKIKLINEDEFTKKMERTYRRWPLEYYSYRTTPGSILPAEIPQNLPKN